jgi:hypothetical protein
MNFGYNNQTPAGNDGRYSLSKDVIMELITSVPLRGMPLTLLKTPRVAFLVKPYAALARRLTAWAAA